jgi:hypothetical protein
MLLQHMGYWIPPVPLQKEDSIAEDRVGQYADTADIHQDGSVSDIVYVGQVCSLSGT